MKNNNELIVPKLSIELVESMVYEIRGVKVMLDFDLAKIYGYETKKFNQQVKRNVDKFPKRYMFKLSKKELETLFININNNFAGSQNVTARMWTDGNSGGRTTLPYAFTEQGIYMLMTVLKGELAVKQSIALIDTFKAMKDYLLQDKGLLLNTNDYLESRFHKIDTRLDKTDAQLAIIMENFIDPSKFKHYLIFNGQRVESDIAYRRIYNLANSSIIIIDNYIDIKTLELLKVCNKDITITIYSDNLANDKVTDTIINGFIKDTGILLSLYPCKNLVHDRYIFIDYGTNNYVLYSCGASSKDSGNKITTIQEIEHKELYGAVLDKLSK